MEIDSVNYDVVGMWQYYKLHFQLTGIKSPRIVIHGNAGKNNMGDDAICHVILKRLICNLPNCRITIVCYGPEVVNKRYKNLHNVKAVKFKSFKTLKAIINSDLYIIGGGGILNKTNVYSGLQKFRIFDLKGKFMYFAINIAKLFGSLTNIYAIGATSFNDPIVKWLALKTIPRVDIVSMRDFVSIKNFKNAGVKKVIHQILDPAFSLEPAPKKRGIEILKKWGLNYENRDRPLIGLCLRYVPENVCSNDATLNQARKLVNFLIDNNCDVFYIPTSQHPHKIIENDLHLGRKLRSILGSNIKHFYLMEDFYNPDEFKSVLGLFDGVILERLHGMILSCMMGVPIFAISYDKKINVLSEIICRKDIPIDPPFVISHEEFSNGEIYKCIKPFIDNIIKRNTNKDS